MTADLDLTLAGGRYDRTQPLIDGRVQPAGVRLRYLPMGVEEVLWRAVRNDEFQATEMSLAYYMALRAAGDERYVAIPVFPSRAFNHGCIWVPAESDRTSLADLRGATVGVPEYYMTACVWVRGLLREDAGIEPSGIRWRQGGIEQPGRKPRSQLPIADGVEVAPIAEDQTLSSQLAAGEIDAFIGPRIPSTYWSGAVRRLIPGYLDAELAYYRSTGIFPIRHVVVLRRDVYDAYPWVARSLFDAFQEAKRLNDEWLADIVALPVSLPWYTDAWERARREFGPKIWQDGLEPNKAVLEALARYLEQDGAIDGLDSDSLFAPSLAEVFRI